jgi:hypothetical protein
MSDELNELQETATEARAKADELKAALTDESSDEERTTADQAEQAAVDAESAFATAKAEADAAAGAQGDGEPKIGDTCTLPDGSEGVFVEQDGQLVCVSKEMPGVDPNASRTGFVSGARAGDECICPDGRTGTVHKFDEGLVCIPNQG